MHVMDLPHYDDLGLESVPPIIEFLDPVSWFQLLLPARLDANPFESLDMQTLICYNVGGISHIK